MKKDDSENEDETAIWTSLVGNLFGAIMKMYIYQQSNGCDENCPNKRSPKGTYDPEYLDRALNILKEISKKLEGHKYTCDEKMQENLSDQILENTDITFEETVLRDGQATSTFMSATTTSSSKSNFFNVEPMSDPMIAELETESPNISPRTDQSCQTFAVTKPRMEYLLDKEDRTNVFTTKSALTNNDEPSPCSSDDSKRSKKKKGKRQCSRPKKTSSRNSSKITFNEVEFDDNIIDYESFPKNNITFFSNDYANNDNIKEIIRCLGCGRPLSSNESGICGDCKAILAQNALRPKCCSCGNTYTYDTLYGALCKKCLSVLSSYDHPKNNPPPKKPPKIDFINIDKRLYVVPAENNEYAEEIFEDVTICPPNNTIPGSPVNNNLRRESVSSHSCNCSEYEEESESEICIPCTKETSKDVNYKDYPKYNKFNRNYEARHFLISTPQINLHDKPNFPNQCNYNSKILNNQQITSKQLEFQDALNKITEIFNGPDFEEEVFSNKLSRGSIQTIRTFEKEFVFPDHLKIIKTEITTTQPTFPELSSSNFSQSFNN